MRVGLQVSWYWNLWSLNDGPNAFGVRIEGSRHKTGWGVRRMPLLRPFPLWGHTVWGRSSAPNVFLAYSGDRGWLIGRGHLRLVCTITSKLSRFRVRFRVSNLVLGIGQDFRVRVRWSTSCVFTARRYASALYVVVVCPSVRQTWYCIKTAKRRITQNTTVQ